MVAERIEKHTEDLVLVDRDEESESHVFGVWGPDYYTGIVIVGSSVDDKSPEAFMFLVDHDLDKKPDILSILEVMENNPRELNANLSKSFAVTLQVHGPLNAGESLSYSFPLDSEHKLSRENETIVENLMKGNNIDYVLGE